MAAHIWQNIHHSVEYLHLEWQFLPCKFNKGIIEVDYCLGHFVLNDSFDCMEGELHYFIKNIAIDINGSKI